MTVCITEAKGERSHLQQLITNSSLNLSQLKQGLDDKLARSRQEMLELRDSKDRAITQVQLTNNPVDYQVFVRSAFSLASSVKCLFGFHFVSLIGPMFGTDWGMINYIYIMGIFPQKDMPLSLNFYENGLFYSFIFILLPYPQKQSN